MSLNLSYRKLLFGAFLGAWIVGLVTGAHALWRYSSTPGVTGVAPKHWPAEAPMQLQPGRETLVMLAHPHCPCTRASLAELERITARGDVDTWVLFLRPENAQAGWEKTALWESAAAIPRVKPVADLDGNGARAFGAETSGHVLFYDANGMLRFSGGITAARGHEGLSAGGEEIIALMRGSATGQGTSLTFGCPLHSSEVAQ
jgi:hypothetical protein